MTSWSNGRIVKAKVEPEPEAKMDQAVIERADELPLLLYWLQQMQIDVIIDRIWPYPHANRRGLSYGQLALLFVAYVVYQRSHRLSGMEAWVGEHQAILSLSTGWVIRIKDATDDRLGDLLGTLGEDEARSGQVQQALGHHVVVAYQLPTTVGRYDTSSFNVHHRPDEQGQAGGGLLRYGYSKDRRPDLLQFKQGLGTLDPAGVPIFTETVAGNVADDRLYVPAWQAMRATIGHSQFLFVADSKASALTSRAEIDQAGGRYLFPLPLTGKVPDHLRAWVLNPPVAAAPIVLAARPEAGEPGRVVGQGFAVELGLYVRQPDGTAWHHWSERWLVTRSDALAQRQLAQLDKQLGQAETDLRRLNDRSFPSAEALGQAANQLLARRGLVDLLDLTMSETVTEQIRYLGPGRPGPRRPKTIHLNRQVHLTVQRNEAALRTRRHLAGWRIHITNVPTAQLSLAQAIAYYRDEVVVEHGFHRFKRGSLPALPLFLHWPQRIRGLMLLLMIALQLLTLVEFVAQRALAQRQQTLSGLVPGNPRMKTDHPSAERLLAAFSGLHWLGQPTPKGLLGCLVEPLTPLQRQILDLLAVPVTIYARHGTWLGHNYYNST